MWQCKYCENINHADGNKCVICDMQRAEIQQITIKPPAPIAPKKSNAGKVFAIIGCSILLLIMLELIRNI